MSLEHTLTVVPPSHLKMASCYTSWFRRT